MCMREPINGIKALVCFVCFHLAVLRMLAKHFNCLTEVSELISHSQHPTNLNINLWELCYLE